MHDELRCSMRHLQSIIAVVEGLVFYEDNTVATNCGLCLSTVLGWGKVMKTVEKNRIKIPKWSKLIVEELALSLAMSGLTSTSFTIQHKPATHIAIALLQLDYTPSWMKSVFSTACISGIINKLSPRNMSAEIVELFRELYARDYMKKEHMESLQSIFQVIISSVLLTENKCLKILIHSTQSRPVGNIFTMRGLGKMTVRRKTLTGLLLLVLMKKVIICVRWFLFPQCYPQINFAVVDCIQNKTDCWKR